MATEQQREVTHEHSSLLQVETVSLMEIPLKTLINTYEGFRTG